MAHIITCVSVILILLVRTNEGCSVIVEDGHPAQIEFHFHENVTSLTWQLLDKYHAQNVSTCSFENNTCKDSIGWLFQAYISSSGGRSVGGLNISSANMQYTGFACVTNNGQDVYTCALIIYAMPAKPTCGYVITNTDVEITCGTNRIYPLADARLHRREPGLTEDDIHFVKVLSPNTPDPSGYYEMRILYRIALSRMRVVNTFYIDMMPSIYDPSFISIKPSSSDDIVVTFSVPEVSLSKLNCPVGQSVVVQDILTGTSADCVCELSNPGFPKGFARWYSKDNRIVGTENNATGSSTITVSYNYSDANQYYECRPVTVLKANLTGTTYFPKFASCFVTTVQGEPADLECDTPNNITSVTWQLMRGTTRVNLTSCSVLSNNCSASTSYQGYVTHQVDGWGFGLHINSARTNETRFSCLADDGQRADPCVLEVYVAPKKPVCTWSTDISSVNILCQTENVYPAVNAVIHRKEVDLTVADIAPGYPDCNLIVGSDGDYSEMCLWKLPMSSMILQNDMFIQMSARVSNNSLSKKYVVTSDVFSVRFEVPEVMINRNQCPVGTGVRGQSIMIGTDATCNCQLKTLGNPVGSVRWYNAYNEEARQTYNSDRSSTLEVEYYQYFTSNYTFECRPISSLGVNGTSVSFTPQYTSSATAIAIVGLYPLFFILGVSALTLFPA